MASAKIETCEPKPDANSLADASSIGLQGGGFCEPGDKKSGRN